MQKEMIPWSVHRMVPYIRVSTKKQENRSQLDRLQKFFRKSGWEWPTDERIYTEKASAFKGGGLKHRVEFQRLLADIRKDDVKGFVVTRWSRYFRNTKTALIVYEELYALGAAAFSAERPYNPFVPDNKARFIREAAEAETYSLDLATRVRDGKDAQSARGLVFGGPPPFGVSRWVAGRPKWNRDEALIVKQAINTYLEGAHTVRMLSQELSTDERQFSENVVWRWLNNPIYYGLVRVMPRVDGPKDNWRKRHNRAKVRRADFKGIVMRSKYARVKALLAERKKGGRGTHLSAPRQYIFGASLMTCSECGRPLFGAARKTSPANIYRCSAYAKAGLCRTKTRQVLERDLIRQFDLILQTCGPITPDHLAHVQDAARRMVEAETIDTPKIKPLSKIEISRQRDALGLAFARRRMSMDEVNEALAKLDAAEFAEPIRATRKHTRRDMETQIDQLGGIAQDLSTAWNEADDADKRALLRVLVSGMVVNVTQRRIVSICARVPFAAFIQASPAPLPELEPMVFGVEQLFTARIPDRLVELLKVFEDGKPETHFSLRKKSGLVKHVLNYEIAKGLRTGALRFTLTATNRREYWRVG